MESSETRTATTVRMPMTVTREAPSRAGMLRRPKVVSAAVCLKRRIVISTLGECGCDFEPHTAPGRNRAAEERETDGAHEARCDDDSGKVPETDELARARQKQRRDCEPYGSADEAGNECLRQDQRHHASVREPDGLQYCELGGAFADRLHHQSAG